MIFLLLRRNADILLVVALDGELVIVQVVLHMDLALYPEAVALALDLADDLCGVSVAQAEQLLHVRDRQIVL